MFSRIIGTIFVSALLIARAGTAQITAYQWLQQPIGIATSCVASDGDGNCYAAGNYGYVTRISNSGVVSWAVNIPGAADGNVTAITLGPKGEVYVAGYMYDTALSEPPQGSFVNRMFLARLDVSGAFKWLVRSENMYNASASAIVVGPSGGSVYLVGTETDTIVFGNLSLGSSNNSSIFVGRFDQNGKPLWLKKTYDDSRYYNLSQGLSATVDDSENVYVGGQFSDTLNFQGVHDSTGSPVTAIILSLDSGGKTRWVKNYASNSSVSAMCYADGYIFATGSANIVTRLRTNGVVDKVLQNNGAPIGSQAIASDNDGGLLIAGSFSSDMSVGQIKIPGSATMLYLLKLDTGLHPEWATYSAGIVPKPRVALDSMGHEYLCGSTTYGVRLGSNYISNGGYFLIQLDEWTVSCPLIEQGPLCSGDTIEIPVHAVGTYANVNTFTVQISDSLGGFSRAQTIGSLTASKATTVRSVIPRTMHSGSKYRIRVTASNPPVTGIDNGYDLSLRAAPMAFISPSGAIDLCEDDSLTLTASGAEHYLWSTGDTTPQIIVGTTGNYSVFATGNDDCGILLPATQVNVRLSPPVPPVTRSGNVLFGNLTGFNYQWYVNRSAIPGATGPTLNIAYNGTYDLNVSNTYRCSSTSDDFVVDDLLPSSVGQSANTSGSLTLSPNPASQTVTAFFTLQYPERIRISIFDLAGSTVLTKNDLTCPAGTSSQLIDVSRLPSGTYFVKVQTYEAVETRRLIIEQ